MDLAAFKRNHKALTKIWDQVEAHMAIYAIYSESHLGHYYLKSLVEMLNVVLETAIEEKLEEVADSDFIVSYEYDDDSIEFLENLENSAFFS
jgi:hypothetical protein